MNNNMLCSKNYRTVLPDMKSSIFLQNELDERKAMMNVLTK